MYEANGITAGFPLPVGKDGSTVVLISPAGDAVKVSADSFTIQDGTVFFNVPPPAGWKVGFDPALLAETRGFSSVCTVVYPDGTLKQLSQDPWELLVLAQTERDEAKKLLKEAKNAIDAAERVVHVESEIAKEKLSARLEKYGTLVDESIRQAASAARDELRDYLGEMIEEVRTKHQEAVQARDLALAYKDLAHSSCLDAVAETEPKLTEHFQSIANHAIEAYTKTKELWNETASFRDEARSAAATTAADLKQSYVSAMESLTEQSRILKQSFESDLQVSKINAQQETALLVESIRASRESVREILGKVLEAESRLSDMDKAQQARELGMRALWSRISLFKKAFDSRTAHLQLVTPDEEAKEAKEAKEGEE